MILPLSDGDRRGKGRPPREERGLKTIYVGNLPYSVTEDDLRELFAPHGELLSVKLISDRDTGLPRGFGFVEMEAAPAAAAIAALDGTEYKGRTIRINEARDKGARPPRRSF